MQNNKKMIFIHPLSLRFSIRSIHPKIADGREAEFRDITGKFMGHNPFSREKDYVPNFPDRVPGIPIFQMRCISIGNFGSIFLTLTPALDINLERYKVVNETHDRPLKLLFVCLANLCRSPMAVVIAETVYGELIEAESAGIAPGQGPVFPETAFVLKEFYGAEIFGHRPRHVREFRVADFDGIIAMDSSVFIRLAEMKDIPIDKLYGWEIPDPCGLEVEAYVRTARLIEDNLEKLLEKLESE